MESFPKVIKEDYQRFKTIMESIKVNRLAACASAAADPTVEPRAPSAGRRRFLLLQVLCSRVDLLPLCHCGLDLLKGTVSYRYQP